MHRLKKVFKENSKQLMCTLNFWDHKKLLPYYFYIIILYNVYKLVFLLIPASQENEILHDWQIECMLQHWYNSCSRGKPKPAKFLVRRKFQLFDTYGTVFSWRLVVHPNFSNRPRASDLQVTLWLKKKSSQQIVLYSIQWILVNIFTHTYSHVGQKKNL